MQLIDRDALLKEIDKEREFLIEREMYGAEHILVTSFMRLVDDAPTVDICEACNADVYGAVEVVRCEDCKWYDTTEPSGTIDPILYRCRRKRIFVESDDYCKYGERREE